MDPKYFPLVAAAVNLIGITVAILVWRFHVSNRVTPLQVELYKRKLDASMKIGAACLELTRQLAIVRQEEDKEDGLRGADEALTAFRSMYSEYVLLMGSEITRAAMRLVDVCFTLIERHLAVSKGEDDGKGLDEVHAKFGEAQQELIHLCLKSVGSDTVMGGLDVLIGRKSKAAFFLPHTPAGGQAERVENV